MPISMQNAKADVTKGSVGKGQFAGQFDGSPVYGELVFVSEGATAIYAVVSLQKVIVSLELKKSIKAGFCGTATWVV